MSRDPAILLVEDDVQVARQITRAIEAQVLPPPVHVTSGEQAVLWAGANECDICIIDYHLSGINGLETLVRIRQRRPNLPVIMISDAGSERVALDAFHAGVLDYVPKNPGFVQMVAQLVKQTSQSGPEAQVIPSRLIDQDVPDELVAPTYQNRLRVIGRQLDLYGYRSVNLLEVAGGILVRGTPSGSRQPEALEFTDRDFPQLIASAIASRGEGERSRSTRDLLPTGYEDFLRALGHRLDEYYAEAVTITELDEFIAVGGVAKAEGYGNTRVRPLQWLLRADDISYMLDEAYRRRAAVPPPQRPSRFGRMLGRDRES